MGGIDSTSGGSDQTSRLQPEAVPVIGAPVPNELAQKVADAFHNGVEGDFSPHELQLVHSDSALQRVVFDRLKVMVTRDLYIEPQAPMFDLAAPETLTLFRTACREKIRKVIAFNVRAGTASKVVRMLIEIADAADAQEALLSGIVARLYGDKFPAPWCLALATEETLETVRRVCRIQIREAVVRCINGGFALTSEYLALASAETLAYVQEPSEMRAILSHRMRRFFGGFETREFADRVGEVLQSLDPATLHRALYDKTLPPVGLKFHTSDQKLVKFFLNTRGFVAHNQSTCFVAPRPAMNDTFLGLCMSVLNDLRGGFPVPEDSQAAFAPGYVQVCTPERLSNRGCGLASIAYALTHSQQNIDDSMLATNQLPDNRLTIYDKEAVVRGMYIPARDGKTHVYSGRTDFVLARTWEDIRYARLAASLIASSEHENLLFHELSVSFAGELEALLGRHKVSHWLDNSFVVDYEKGPRPSPEENLRYATMLHELSILKGRDAEVIRKHSIERSSVTDIGKYITSPEEKRAELDALITEEVRMLLERYERTLYAHGYVNEFTRL